MVSRSRMKLGRRIASLAASLALAATLVPAAAIADPGPTSNESEATELAGLQDAFRDVLDQTQTASSALTAQSYEDSALVAQASQDVTEKTVKSDEATNITLTAGQELILTVKVDAMSAMVLGFKQTASLSNGVSVKASFDKVNGGNVFSWDIWADIKDNYAFGPFYVDAGTYKYHLVAQCDVTLKVQPAWKAVSDTSVFYDLEPNDTIETATPITPGVSVMGSAYDPKGEVSVLGSMMGMTEIDIYSFHVDARSKLTLGMTTTGRMHYELVKDPSEKSLKQGETSKQGGTAAIDLGTVDPGTYYFYVVQLGDVWKDPYVFKILAEQTEITRVELSQSEFTYDGKYCRPTVSAWAGDTQIAKDVDINSSDSNVKVEGNQYAKNAGTYTVTVTGKGKYTGTVEASFTIKPREITRIVPIITRYTYYEGSPYVCKPSVEVYCGADKVEYISYTAPEEENFIAEYPENPVLPGTYEVKVNAFGNYTGTLTASYVITDRYGNVPTTSAITEIPSTPNEPDTSTSAQPEPSGPTGQPMYRLYNPNSGEHFYTADANERNNLISIGWDDEGTGWTAPASGDEVYRLYNPAAGEHHYTLNASERDMLVRVGWNDEGVGWYSDTEKKVPLYRVYNPNKWANNHHYTTDAGERDYLLSIGWRDEDISWHGI